MAHSNKTKIIRNSQKITKVTNAEQITNHIFQAWPQPPNVTLSHYSETQAQCPSTWTWKQITVTKTTTITPKSNKFRTHN